MEVGRNRYGLTIEIELTHPVVGKAAEAAADLAARDIHAFLKGQDWGYGVARIESVYAPRSQFEHGDFYPNTDEGIKETATQREP